MNQTLFSFLITFIAGISTIIGVIPCYMKENKKDKIIAYSLAFSAGVMLTISLSSLIPEAVVLFNNIFKIFPLIIICAIFIVLGILFSQFIDQKIEEKFTSNKLYKLGIISIIVLILHNIPEGITTFISTSTNLELGLSLSLAIALHNIPEGISIAVPIYYATRSRKKAFGYTLISGFSELLGAVLAYLFIARFVNDFILAIILAMTAGIMIHISIYELIPNAYNYHAKKGTTVAFIVGIIVMLLCDILM